LTPFEKRHATNQMIANLGLIIVTKTLNVFRNQQCTEVLQVDLHANAKMDIMEMVKLALFWLMSALKGLINAQTTLIVRLIIYLF
jgi:hypothetical protein